MHSWMLRGFFGLEREWGCWVSLPCLCLRGPGSAAGSWKLESEKKEDSGVLPMGQRGSESRTVLKGL